MNKIKVYYSPHNGGDGSVYLKWFLTAEAAEYDQDNLDEGWGEDCSGFVETFEGSDVHLKAIESDNDEDEEH
jgi:hypothetical protein